MIKMQSGARFVMIEKKRIEKKAVPDVLHIELKASLPIDGEVGINVWVVQSLIINASAIGSRSPL